MDSTTIDKAHLNWCVNILKIINDILQSGSTNDSKIEQITWLTKQALKIEREE